MVTTVYLSSYPQPTQPPSYLAVFASKCQKVDQVRHEGVTPPADRLPIFQRIDFPKTNVELVTERGNIHELTGADASLFRIPDGFRPW